MIPTDCLGGTSEVAETLGCSPQQIYSLRKREDFPQPLCLLAATPIWDLRLIEEFKHSWRRRGSLVSVG